MLRGMNHTPPSATAGTAPITIVTGASRGLGLALAEQCLAQGHRVLAIARQRPALQHPALTAWQADLADASGVQA